MIARQLHILETLSDGQEVSVADLAQRFGVSPMTIRRDLSQLGQASPVHRTHGGAVLTRLGSVEFAFEHRGRAAAAQKRAIAIAIAKRIQPKMRVALDTGTTTLEVARAISGTRDLTVLTSSLPIASTLYAHENIELVLLGGMARKGNPDLSGWLTEDNLRRFEVDVAIVGADAANRRGVYTTDVNVARVSSAMLDSAKHSILAIDSSKFAASAFVRYTTWNGIGELVTDSAVPRSVRTWLDKTVQRVEYVRPQHGDARKDAHA